MFTRLFTVIFCCLWGTAALAQDAGFDRWVADFKASALVQGIPASILEDALIGLVMDDRVVELDQKQPENKITLEKYLHNTINARRIRIGREMMVQHHDVLARISAKYHVQPQYLVALWGIESDFGMHKGDFSVVQSLATLAYEGRRREFFTGELLASLKILTGEHMTSDQLTGSWAGAMGDCQFMPTTYLRYAADGDGDGKRDIWNSVPDVLASIGNYLHALGWQDDRGWGVPVQVPENFTESEADIKHPQTAASWRARGLQWERSAKISHGEMPTYAIYVGQMDDGAQPYLVTDNYKAILEWNRSRYFATAVGTLADAIAEPQ